MIPAMCSTDKAMLNHAHIKKKYLSKYIAIGSLLVCLLIMVTTAALSHNHRIWWSAMSLPHIMAQEMTIGSAPLPNKDKRTKKEQITCCYPQHPHQHPQEPEASMTSLASIGHLQRADIMATLFHVPEKVCPPLKICSKLCIKLQMTIHIELDVSKGQSYGVGKYNLASPLSSHAAGCQSEREEYA